MNKTSNWLDILGVAVGAILIVVGAFVFISSEDKSAARPFLIPGMGLTVFSIAWLLLRKRRNNKASI
jgi:uncharacterized membrane protein